MKRLVVHDASDRTRDTLNQIGAESRGRRDQTSCPNQSADALRLPSGLGHALSDLSRAPCRHASHPTQDGHILKRGVAGDRAVADLEDRAESACHHPVSERLVRVGHQVDVAANRGQTGLAVAGQTT